MKSKVVDLGMQYIKKYKYAVGILMLGVLFLCWPSGEKESIPVSEASEAESSYLEDTEERMESILSRINGVGKLKLMLTVEAGSEEKLARDGSVEYSGSAAAPEDYTRTESYVILSKAGGGEEVVVTKSIYPVYRGALVVCEGGDDPGVKLALLDAIGALTGLSSDKISIIKWQS